MKNVPRYRLKKPVSLFSDKHKHIYKGFFYHHFRKKSSNVFSCVEILQYLSYEQYEQHRESKISKVDMK